jgi:excisionase family DNA binding protein
MEATSFTQGTRRPVVEARFFGRCKCGRVRPESGRQQLIDITELAQQLATSRRHVRRLVEERRIPYLKIGHYVRFDPEDIETWLDGQRVSMHCEEEEPGGPPWVHLLKSRDGQGRMPSHAPRRESSGAEDGYPPWVRNRAAEEER